MSRGPHFLSAFAGVLTDAIFYIRGPVRLFNGYVPGACRLVLTSAIMGQIMPFIKDTSKAIENAFGI